MNEKKQKIINLLLVAFIVFISLFIGYNIGSKTNILPNAEYGNATPKLKITDKDPPFKFNKDIDFNLFWTVWDLLKAEHVDKSIDDTKLFYGAIEGMVASVGDPYTIFLKPEIAKEFNDELSGEFEGIGAEIGVKQGRITVIAPLPDTPAEKAGLRSGDKIFAIDGEDTLDMSLDEAVSKIRGEKGTEVILTVINKNLEAKEIKIIRGAIKFDSVRWKIREDKLAYIEVIHFNTDTVFKFDEAVQEIVKEDPKGIILDLRGNPGGFLDAAIKMASRWIDSGIVVIEQYSEDNKREHKAVGRAFLSGFKTVVLINGGSASGSEIVAGALKDHGQAILIGTKTFGKGSVQSLEEFEDGSSIKFTVAKWLTPNGHCIKDTGIDPDVEIDFTEEDYNNDVDPQLDKAVEILLP